MGILNKIVSLITGVVTIIAATILGVFLYRKLNNNTAIVTSSTLLTEKPMSHTDAATKEIDDERSNQDAMSRSDLINDINSKYK